MLKAPAIDIAEVGTGAGSIAWIDTGGLLRVGPRSAGARPGPACYGTGGTEPTITDANVVLGYLDPERLAGGELKLAGRSRARGDRAPRRHAARTLGRGGRARDPRRRQRQHGARDPRGHHRARARPARLHAGGLRRSGPAHACDVAAALDIRRVLVPVAPGVFTAVGMLASDVTHHFVRAAGGALEDTATLGRARTALAELSAEALVTLAGEGYPGERVEIEVLADLRYAGQASELVVPIPGGRLEGARLGDLRMPSTASTPPPTATRATSRSSS